MGALLNSEHGAGPVRVTTWVWPLAGAVALWWPYTRVSAKSAGSALLYDGFILACALVILLSTRRQPPGSRAAWYLMVGALAAFVGGDLGWYLVVWVAGAPPESVSVADIGYLAYYPLLTTALLMMLRRRSPGRDTLGLLDASILATGLGLVVWVFLVIPNASDSSEPLIGRLVAVGYPVMDVVLLGVAMRLVTTRGQRPVSFLLLVAGTLCMFGADVAYSLQSLYGTYTAGGWLDMCWPASHALLAASALHPSARLLMLPLPDESSPGLTQGRLVAMAGATLLAPAVAAVAPAGSQRLLALTASAVLFLMVLGRTAALTAALSRTEARFRSLVHHGADPIVVLDANATLRYTSPAWARLLGEGPRPVGTDFLDRVHPDVRDHVRQELRLLADAPPGSSRAWVTRLQHADGGWRHVEALSTNRLADPAVGGLVLNLRDVTERAALEEQLRQAAFHDPLTGLANRSLFIDRLDQALTSLERSEGSVAVLFIDLDDFKSVNDTRGHAAGDLLLRTVAERLSGCVRPYDTVARLGGDEFAVLLPSLTGQDQVDGVLERIQLALSEPTGIAGWDRPAAASIGLATAHRPQSADTLLRAADLDMYAAKRSRKKVSTAAGERLPS